MIAAGGVGDAASDGLGTDRWYGAIEDGHGGHPSDQRGQRAAGQGVGTATGQADDAEPLDVECIGHLRHVGTQSVTAA